MRYLFFLLSFSSFLGFTQKMPIGLLVKFEASTSLEAKALLGEKMEGLKPFKQEHELKGFEVALYEGLPGLSEMDYKNMRATFELNPSVIYTSIIYQSVSGAIAADLQELYVKPKEVDFNHLPMVTKLNCYKVERHYAQKDVWVYSFDKNSNDIRTTQAELMATGLFQFVSVNTLHSVLATVDDPYYNRQWALENDGSALHFDGTAGADMSVPEAWDISTGDPTMKIAVLDSGADTNHVDLKNNLLPGFDATGGGTMGYPNTTYSNDGHGTCTAGIIAAEGNNGIGIAGVAYSSKVIPVRIFYYISFGGDIIPFTSSEAGTDGIIWAINTADADILSNSWGLRASDILVLGIDTAFSNAVIRDNMDIGRGGKGTPMLFSSGNDGDNFSIWPASLNETISVGASTMCDELKSPSDCSPEGWWGSNYGDNLDVTAPGVKVLSTDMSGALGYNGFADQDYAMFNGTSAACPNAAGVMALILSVDPSLSAYDARSVLAITADKTGGYAYDESEEFGMRSFEMGYGRVNAYNAVYYASNFTRISSINHPSAAYIAQTNQGAILHLNGQTLDAIQVYNVQGQCIAELNSIVDDELNLSNFITVRGLYFISFIENGQPHSLKVVL